MPALVSLLRVARLVLTARRPLRQALEMYQQALCRGTPNASWFNNTYPCTSTRTLTRMTLTHSERCVALDWIGLDGDAEAMPSITCASSMTHSRTTIALSSSTKTTRWRTPTAASRCISWEGGTKRKRICSKRSRSSRQGCRPSTSCRTSRESSVVAPCTFCIASTRLSRTLRAPSHCDHTLPSRSPSAAASCIGSSDTKRRRSTSIERGQPILLVRCHRHPYQYLVHDRTNSQSRVLECAAVTTRIVKEMLGPEKLSELFHLPS